MEFNNVTDILECTDWFDKNDIKVLADSYMLQCAIQRRAYCCKEDVITDGGEPVKLKVRVIIDVEEVK